MRHNASCTAIDDGQRFETSNLDNMGILLFTVNKSTAQLRGYREADLRLCFYIFIQAVFPMMLLNIIFLVIACRPKKPIYTIRLWAKPLFGIYFVTKMNGHT